MTLDPEAMSMESKNCPQVVTSTEFTTTINMDASTVEESQVNQSNLISANRKETATSNEPSDHRSSSSQNHHHESGHHLTNGHPSDHHHHHHTSSHRPLDVVFNNISVAVKQSTNSKSKSRTNTRIFDIFSSIKSKLKSSSSSLSSNDPSSCPSNLPQNQNSGPCNNNQSSSNKYILQSISGSAVPGQILGIMGPSGSGKTTLLSTLSGRLKIDEGSITMNGEILNKQLRRKICYVLQQDIFFPDLTLRQTLLYTALLRLPESMDYEKKVKHVDNIIDVLDLRQCQHTIIGDMAKRGLSGGEKKRASIACELLTNPSVLLIDEPTSGLDSSTAHSLMQLLKSYAVKEKKTVIITIHQPSSQIFHMFDKLLLLTNGQLAYFGQTDSVVPFFDSLGYRMSTHFNPADFVLERIKNGNQEETRVIVTAAKSLVESSIEFHSNGHGHHHHHSSSHVHGGHHHHHHHSRKSSHGQTEDFPTSDHPLLGSDHEVWPSNESSDDHDPENGHNPDGHKSECHQMRTIVVIDGDGHEKKVTTMNDCDSGRSSWSEADRSSTKTFSSNSSSCSDDLNALENGHHACSVNYDKWATSFWTQLRILTKRNFYEARGRMLSKLNWIQTIGLALVTGCIWYQIPRSEETLNDIKGWMFFSMTYWMLFALFNALVSFPPEREVINKERASGAYRLSSYYIAKMIGELPLTLAMPTTFHFISYPMLGCYNISTFFYLWIFQILSSVVAQSVGLFVGAATVDLEVSITISALYSMSSILFGGFYSTTMPYWLSWLRYLSIVYYALQNMLQIEFSVGEPIRCSSEGGVSKYASCQFGNKSESFIPYEELKLRLDTMNYGSEPLPIWLNTIILILFLIFFRGMGYLVLKYIRKPK